MTQTFHLNLSICLLFLLSANLYNPEILPIPHVLDYQVIQPFLSHNILKKHMLLLFLHFLETQSPLYFHIDKMHNHLFSLHLHVSLKFLLIFLVQILFLYTIYCIEHHFQNNNANSKYLHLFFLNFYILKTLPLLLFEHLMVF